MCGDCWPTVREGAERGASKCDESDGGRVAAYVGRASAELGRGKFTELDELMSQGPVCLKVWFSWRQLGQGQGVIPGMLPRMLWCAPIGPSHHGCWEQSSG